MDKIKTPRISIITVSYNAVDYIEDTIKSVINQEFKDFEYLIIDGGSKDGTLDIIKKYENRVSFWISEPDRGIYDAMNKGVVFAKGEWCYFLNAGDSFYDDSVLMDLNLLPNESDVIYGSINCITKSSSFILKPQPIANIINSMVFCHQAVFVKSIILKEYNFNTDFKIAADYDFFRRLYFNKYRFNNVDLVIANYEAEEGVSSTNIYKMFKEYAIIKGNWNNVFVKGEVHAKSIKHRLINSIRKRMPVKWRALIKRELQKIRR